ncbi:MAG TPA: efflux RND transporter periplasmic adaptor subunit, partial [Candidatus Dormibacteraeota bacterium]|nr:efflux RND transporter periplasmic adaptor subunit [Candidatus Dormibacteraeota bacterium]
MNIRFDFTRRRYANHRMGRRGSARFIAGAFGRRVSLWLAAGALVALAGCNRMETRSQNQMTSFSAKGVEASYFSVPENQLPRVQIVAAVRQKIERVLQLPGAVGYNLFRTTPVITPVGGPVTRILVVPGQTVTQGEPLLYVQSADFSQLRANYLKTRDAYQLAETNEKRSQDLYAHKAIAESALLQAQSARSQALADLQAAQQALQALGVAKPQQAAGSASAQFPVLAPIGGEVVERLVAPGQLLQAGSTQCFTVSDMSTVWVLVNVYQNDLS